MRFTGDDRVLELKEGCKHLRHCQVLFEAVGRRAIKAAEPISKADNAAYFAPSSI
jgi:hypothetical protein